MNDLWGCEHKTHTHKQHPPILYQKSLKTIIKQLQNRVWKFKGAKNTAERAEINFCIKLK